MLTCDFEYQREDFKLKVKFDVGQQILGVIGPSGVGKTTLLHNITGLLRPTCGHITLAHQVLTNTQSNVHVPVHERKIALVFQNALLFPHMNVKQNLLYSPHTKNQQRPLFSLDDIIEILDIRPLLQRKAHQLSGGEAQRISIGRALMSSPQLLLLDEPLTGLNTTLKQQILGFLNQIHQQYQLPMIYVSHHAEELKTLNADLYPL